MSAAPEPVIVSEVCSLCGLDWKRHGKKPTSEKCVELLLDEVRRLNAQLAHRPIVRPYLPQPYPVPIRPYYPWWQSTWGGKYTYASNVTQHTPQLSAWGANASSNQASSLVQPRAVAQQLGGGGVNGLAALVDEA